MSDQDSNPMDEPFLERGPDDFAREAEVIKPVESRVRGMYREYFLEYASYVILERAVPALEDGLKPVQRRLMHALYEMEDGRFHKEANVIGQTMKYHPHGDASIGDALVQLGQKILLIDTQGNWGNIYTGDSAAAPRYIEARLSKFALDVAFAPKITQYLASYDGRSKEPVFLPVKFPLLLVQGVEGYRRGLEYQNSATQFCGTYRRVGGPPSRPELSNLSGLSNGRNCRRERLPRRRARGTGKSSC